MIVHIGYDELFNENALMPSYGITDNAFLLLYNFYKSHSVENHYIVDASSTKVDDASVNLLRAYGIRFEDTASDNPEDKEYQFFIIPEDKIASKESLMNYIGTTTVPGLLAGYGVVEKDYSISSDYSDSVLISEVAPTIKIINPNFYKPTVSLYKSLDENLKTMSLVTNRVTGNKFHTVNVSKYFEDFNSTDINFYIDSCMKIINSIEKLNLTEDDVLYIDGTVSSELVKQAAMHIAAYLFVAHEIKWEFFNAADNEVFRALLAKARSNEYMFLNDYLEYLRNFPTFTASCCAGSGYICVKDENLLAQNKSGYGINLTLYRAKIDTKEWRLLQDFDKNKVITSLRNINQIKRFRDLSDIGSHDSDAAFKALKTLSDLFKTINMNLLDLGILATNELANINNVMIYTVGGTDYVAYVSNISGKLPFVLKPTVGNYPAFQVSYDIKELWGLHDIRLFYDAPKWYYKMIQALHLKQSDIKHIKYDKDTIKGILLQGYLESNKTLSTKHLSVAEVGIWSMQTGSFRTQNKNLFFDLFNKRVALKNNMFTMFGVGHPQLGTNVVVTSDLWRYNNC